ncbi:hypothetical protein [Demequina flava]|uniref:hypothetical protein n=1 Tax=Demequina flava TaxID=1095025 RepID=UPI000780E94C|nr:hypothetical protein [Demequina flava]
MSSEEQAVPLAVSGGAGGTQAVTTDLTAAAVIVDTCAGLLSECSLRLRIAHASLLFAQTQAVPTVWDDVNRAKTAVEDARYGVDSCEALDAALTDCAEGLRVVAAGYEEAERAASAGLSLWGAAGRYFGDILGAQLWVGRVLAAGAWKTTPLGALGTITGKDRVGSALMPDRAPAVTGVVNRATVTGVLGLTRTPVGTPPIWGLSAALGGPSMYDAAATGLRGVFEAGEYWAGEPRMEGVEFAEPVAGPSELAGFESMMGNLGEVSSSPHGEIAYDVYGEGADASVFVYIPGTEDHGLSDGATGDWHGNFTQMTTDDFSKVDNLNDLSQLVANALLEAGLPPDAPITLVGHSQGAAAAASVAACEEVTSQLNITNMVLVGSPHGDVPNNPDVDTVVIANVQDPVPGSDGLPDNAAPNVTYVNADLRASSDPDIAALGDGPISAHGIETYRHVGASMDLEAASSVVAAREALTKSTAGRQATRTYARPTFEAPQEPRPQPNVEPRPGPSIGPTVSPSTPSSR